MARNLLRAGHSVALWSNTAAKVAQLAAEAGGVACATPAEVARQADVVFLCVGDTEMVEQILLGKNGVIEGARKGMIVVDASTISPSASCRIGEDLLRSRGRLSWSPRVPAQRPGRPTARLRLWWAAMKRSLKAFVRCSKSWARSSTIVADPGMGLHAKLTSEPGALEHPAGLQRRHCSEHQGRRRSDADARYSCRTARRNPG